MQCKKCRAQIPDDAVFCHRCGAKQTLSCRPKSRGNGQGSAYQLPNKSWIAVVTLGYTIDEAGKKHRLTRSKSGFKTKRDAVAALPALRYAPKPKKAPTLKETYDKWIPTHRAGKSTIDNYKAAFRYFKPLWYYRLADIEIDDLQDCMDDCPRSKSTQEKMKACIGLIYKYAIPRGLATVNLGQYLYVNGEAGNKDGLPMDALAAIQKAVGTVPYADYVLAQCYLGFRPSELLALDARDYDRQQRAFTGGSKTDAGRDRVVTVSPKIQPIIDRLVGNKISGPVFCAPDGSTMGIKAYREAFYALLQALGISNPVTVRDGMEYHKYTPHSCRHTFATLMKGVNAPDKDKLRLIGHTSTEMLRHYQDVDIEGLRKITDAL